MIPSLIASCISQITSGVVLQHFVGTETKAHRRFSKVTWLLSNKTNSEKEDFEGQVKHSPSYLLSSPQGSALWWLLVPILRALPVHLDLALLLFDQSSQEFSKQYLAQLKGKNF